MGASCQNCTPLNPLTLMTLEGCNSAENDAVNGDEPHGHFPDEMNGTQANVNGKTHAFQDNLAPDPKVSIIKI